MTTEKLILNNLIKNESYTKKVLPHLKDEYFSDDKYKFVFKEIDSFNNKYGKTPSIDALRVILEGSSLNENLYKEVDSLLSEIVTDETNKEKLEWLVDESEKFCQDKALYNGIMDSIQIMDGKSDDRPKGSIPDILNSALSVCFDNHVGHDYLDDYSNRYDFYNHISKRIPFDLKFFNEITGNGLTPKTLTIVLAGTAVGKSLFMCHVSAAALLMNYNILYITMEMAEERIAERIDANILNIPMDQLRRDVPRDLYEKKINKFRETCKGKLIIKEYPTGAANVGHFRALLNELKTKKGFVPDLVCIDYLNICSSSRLKAGSNVNSYTYVKAIAEEIRGLGVEFDVPIISATQTTRSGFTNSDPGLEDTSESFGLPATADLMFALVAPEELQKMNQIMVKQLKNRYSDPNRNKRFIIGVDKTKMRLYDVEQTAQDDLSDAGQQVNKPKRSGLVV